jgi:hypothetical protein
MREAEIAVVQHTATPAQDSRVHAMAHLHTRAERRRMWMELDAAEKRRARQDGDSTGPAAALPHPRGGRHLPWHRTGTRRG